MGYSTDFEGEFKLDRPLAPEHAAFLRAFNDTRRMSRDGKKTPPDPIRDAAGLPNEQAYFVSGGGFCGQEHDASVTDYNGHYGQPGLWCKWAPNEDGTAILWDGAEKFYDYTEWLEYIVEHFLKRWGYVLNGEVKWQREYAEDFGLLVVKDNVVSAREGKRTYE